MIKAYPDLKESTLDWLGKIPTHWDLKKIKYVFNNLDYKRIPLSSEDRGMMKEKIYDYYGASGVIDKVENYIFDEPLILIGEDGANLYSRSTPLAFVATGKYWVNNHAHILKPKDGNLYYWANLLECIDYSVYITGSAQPKLTQEALANIELPVPNNLEQESIWRFLSPKLIEIDKLLSKQKKLIGSLEEKRQIIITETITKGLNPNVKMKDSGVGWIGEIPKGWNITKVKYNSYVKGRIGWQGLKSDEFTDEGPFLVTGSDFKKGMVNWEWCYHISEKRYNEAPPIQLNEKDLLITKDGTIGKLAIVKNMPGKAILNSGIFVVRPLNNKYLTDYMYWILSSGVFEEYVKIMGTGSTIKHLYQETFINFSYPLPKIEEQHEINEYLKERVEKVDQTIENTLSQIQKLKEYRQSLIYEAVTGKIDVRKLMAEK